MARLAAALVGLFPLLLALSSPPACRAGEDAPTEVGEAPLLSAGPLEYRPGRGLRLGSTGGVIGGFTNVKAESTQESGGEFALDNLNFFLIFDRFTRFRAVAELQLKDVFVADDGGAGTHDFAFDVRRLFGDFTVADELHLRAGTFLTPVGYWNLILAPPLTWTTEAPLIVEEIFFQQTTTGFMVHGTTPVSGGQLGYSVFSQFLKPLEDDPDLNPPAYTAGGRLEYEVRPSWSIGATYQAAENNDAWSHLGAFHVLWQHRRGEILSELYFQEGDRLSVAEEEDDDDEDLGSSQWGMYLQGVLEVYEPFYLVGRYEHLDPALAGPSPNLFLIGAVWKPFPFMAVKVEYRFADHKVEDEDPEGFFTSFSTFF